MIEKRSDDKWLDRNCWKNKSRLYRYFAMLNLCIVGFVCAGEFVAYDSLGALQDYIMENMDLSAQELSYLYSVGSWPAIVLCFFGGYLIDKVFGIKWGTVIYTSVVLYGHFIFALGILLNIKWCALLGRFFFGVGVEFILICLLYYSVYYFKAKELSMVQCLTLALSRLGSSAVFEMAYPMLRSLRTVYKGKEDVGIVVFMVGCFTVASVISSVILLFMSPNKSSKSDENKQKIIKDIQIADVLHFGIPFWLTVIASCGFCMNIYIFLPFSQGFFMRHGLNASEADRVSGFMSLMGAVSAFAIGNIVDRTGRQVSFVVFGFSLACISCIILAFTTVNPFFSMFLLAMSFSFLAASVFPLYAYIVPENMLGTAYGTMQAIVNLSFAMIIKLAGNIVNNYGYQALEILVLGNELVGLISSILLWFYNYKTRGNLNWTAAHRRNDFYEQERNSCEEDQLNRLSTNGGC